VSLQKGLHTSVFYLELFIIVVVVFVSSLLALYDEPIITQTEVYTERKQTNQ